MLDINGNKIKLEGSDLWTDVRTSTEAEQQSVDEQMNIEKEKIQDFIVSNIGKINFTYESEDGIESATLKDFENAMDLARLEELQSFSKDHTLFFEDGYIRVVLT